MQSASTVLDQRSEFSAWWERLAVFDLETTGVDVATARIVTAWLGVLDADGDVVERSDWLANPGVEIPEQATAVHGVSTQHARQFGRPAGTVVAELVDGLAAVFAKGLPLVIYNAPYDLTVLHREALRHGVTPLTEYGPVIDPLVVDRAVDRYRKGKRTLTAAATHYGVALADAHDAGADAVAAGRVAQALARRYAARLAVPAGELHSAQVDWCREQSASFEAYMRRSHNPGFVASGLWPIR